MESDSIKRLIVANAEEVRRLHARIHDTHLNRTASPLHLQEWQQACEAFHARFDALSFPGGYATARARIASGDPEAIESALCFVECRPYFFRSGYMFDALVRRLKHVTMTKSQTERFQSVLARLQAWRDAKKARPGA